MNMGKDRTTILYTGTFRHLCGGYPRNPTRLVPQAEMIDPRWSPVLLWIRLPPNKCPILGCAVFRFSLGLGGICFYFLFAVEWTWLNGYWDGKPQLFRDDTWWYQVKSISPWYPDHGWRCTPPVEQLAGRTVLQIAETRGYQDGTGLKLCKKVVSKP